MRGLWPLPLGGGGRDPICAVCGGGGSSRRRAGDRAFYRFFAAVSRISPGVPKLPDLVVTATEKADPPGVMLQGGVDLVCDNIDASLALCHSAADLSVDGGARAEPGSLNLVPVVGLEVGERSRGVPQCLTYESSARGDVFFG